jgi:predicted N-acyltransferase
MEELRILTSISEVSEREWNALEHGDFPFTDHRFLKALEDSGSVGRRTGWMPRHIVLYQGRKLFAALPCYLKTNSYGEYIFDWAWARAAEINGIPYYPKLVSSIPFTPASGPKFLMTTADSSENQRTRLRLAFEFRELQSQLNAHSSHVLFSTPIENEALSQSEFMIRHSFQYHWQNRDWTSFEDFLNSLKSKRRKEIRHERAHVDRHKVKIEVLTGDKVAERAEELSKTMYRFYRSTIDKMGGIDYLSEDFFRQIFHSMAESILLVYASRVDSAEPVAGALNFYRGKSLFGRYWGCLEDYKNLHFELCYYQGIEWAIQHRVKLFEAGAQGEHKLSRGFLPNLTFSAHSIGDEKLGRAVADFIEEEKVLIRNRFAEYKEHDPFKSES